LVERRKAKAHAPRYLLSVYLAGAALTAIYLVWSAVASGGLERQHTAGEFVFLAIMYTAYCILWPVWVIIFCLMYFGVVHGPIQIGR
jgi:hypothetical protein